MTNRHLMETQNLVISFDYSWFLAKNLAYNKCRIMKFHYRNSSIGYLIKPSAITTASPAGPLLIFCTFRRSCWFIHCYYMSFSIYKSRFCADAQIDKKKFCFKRNGAKIGSTVRYVIWSKGQLISKCLYEVIVWTKIPTKNLIISALKGPGQKLSKISLVFWSKL